jgi:peroxiredoxin
MKSSVITLLLSMPFALVAQEAQIETQLHQLRKLPDAERIKVTQSLAIEIRQLPATSDKKEPLAEQLANLVTEGDPGQETLQEVAATLADALHQHPTADGFATLAELVRYEHVQVSCDDPQFTAATRKLEADDRARQHADFTLTDLNGMKWSLRSLAGKVVLVNFWATWCPPCRKEMPDMEALYQRFSPRGLVILAISDEDSDKVKPFIAEKKYDYPVLLDPGHKVGQLFDVVGIPKSFLYGQKLVTRAIDRRTEQQFLAMLKQAGLE